MSALGVQKAAPGRQDASQRTAPSGQMTSTMTALQDESIYGRQFGFRLSCKGFIAGMGPDELRLLMPDTDYGVPSDVIDALPVLPDFNDTLRLQMQREVTLYRKPVLSIDDRNWGWLYIILSAHEQRALEAAALDEHFPAQLSRKSTDDLRSAQKLLRRAQASVKSARRRDGASRLIDKAIDTTIDDLLAKIDTTVAPRVALQLDPNPAASRRGLLEVLLCQWWISVVGRPPSVRKGGSAYQTFLRLCYSVLTTRPGIAEDRVQVHRAAWAVSNQRLDEAIKGIKEKLAQK